MATGLLNLKLVDDNLGLAEVVARRYYRGQEPIRDTEQFSIACAELVRLIGEYDPQLGESKFSRLAFRSMKNAVIDYMRRNHRKKRTATFESMTDKNWQKIASKSDSEFILPVELLRRINLGDRADRCLLEDVYIKRKKISDIAKQQKISRVTVYNRLQRILERIKQQNCDLIESSEEIANVCYSGQR